MSFSLQPLHPSQSPGRRGAISTYPRTSNSGRANAQRHADILASINNHSSPPTTSGNNGNDGSGDTSEIGKETSTGPLGLRPFHAVVDLGKTADYGPPVVLSEKDGWFLTDKYLRLHKEGVMP